MSSSSSHKNHLYPLLESPLGPFSEYLKFMFKFLFHFGCENNVGAIVSVGRAYVDGFPNTITCKECICKKGKYQWLAPKGQCVRRPRCRIKICDPGFKKVFKPNNCCPSCGKCDQRWSPSVVVHSIFAKSEQGLLT